MSFLSGLHPKSKVLAIKVIKVASTAMMKTHKEKRITGALLIACLITQGGYSQEKREHTEPPGPSSLESLGSGAEWTTPFPGFS
jgi:hypothetical protein